MTLLLRVMNDLESQTWGRWREGHGEEARVAMFLRTLSKREKTYLLMEERQSTGNVWPGPAQGLFPSFWL